MESSKDNINLLFTSVGRRVELLRAFKLAYRSLGLAGNIVALDADPLAPALQVADHPFIVPRMGDPLYISTLVDICQSESINVVFPLIDPDVTYLSSHKTAILSTGANVAVVSPEVATKTSDKWDTTQFLTSIGLCTPQSWLPGQIDPQQAKYPLFMKPRHGSASRYTFKIHNKREFEFFINYVPEPIIQECLPGPEITNDVICDLDGEILGISSRQRIEVRWGEVAKGITVHNPQIINACKMIAESLPTVGPITVQCMMKGDIPHFTEINARMGGGLPLGIAAGVDAPLWLLARIAGIKIDIPHLGDYQVGLSMTRCDESFFLSLTDRDAMNRNRFYRDI